MVDCALPSPGDLALFQRAERTWALVKPLVLIESGLSVVIGFSLDVLRGTLVKRPAWTRGTNRPGKAVSAPRVTGGTRLCLKPATLRIARNAIPMLNSTRPLITVQSDLGNNT